MCLGTANYYTTKIKAGRFRKRYLSCNRFARKYFVRVRCLEKFCSLFINMTFVTDAREFQTVLNARLTVRDSETLTSANF